MGDPKGFLKVKREAASHRPVPERVKDYHEIVVLPAHQHTEGQGSRCMDCGTPFCHWGCPIGNFIPEWNDLVFRGQWQKAFQLLQGANNFPEITGRLCPAPCEYACVLGINDDPVTIRENELAIMEVAFKKGYIRPNVPKRRTGKSIAVVGSGPAGLACADQLNKAGHKVVVFETDDKNGGILRYGIPDFKLEKWIIDRRLDILRKEGVEFTNKVKVGVDMPLSKLRKGFDAMALACGSRVPRDLKVEGRDLNGIYFAMEYLIQSNKRVQGIKVPQDTFIDAKGKRVVVIGGGDTGADCVGTAHRQGAASVTQIEILPKPPTSRIENQPWPTYPLLFKTSTSHEEGGERQWSVTTKKFIGEGGCVKKLLCAKADASLKEIPGTDFEIYADLVLLALGFLHPEHKGLVNELKLELDQRGNIKTGEGFMASSKGVFSLGDMHRGQSLVAWAIHEGRRSAYFIDKYLMGESSLPLV